MSVPTSNGVIPKQIAAAAPPLEPPAVRWRFHGLLVRPNSGLLDCQSESMAATLVLAISTPPAAFSLMTTGLSCSATWSAKGGKPTVVLMPDVSCMSFSVNGTP